MSDPTPMPNTETAAQMIAIIVRLAEILHIPIEDATAIFVKVGKVFDPSARHKVQ